MRVFGTRRRGSAGATKGKKRVQQQAGTRKPNQDCCWAIPSAVGPLPICNASSRKTYLELVGLCGVKHCAELHDVLAVEVHVQVSKLQLLLAGCPGCSLCCFCHPPGFHLWWLLHHSCHWHWGRGQLLGRSREAGCSCRHCCCNMGYWLGPVGRCCGCWLVIVVIHHQAHQATLTRWRHHSWCWCWC